MPVATMVRDPMERAMNRLQVLPHQNDREGRINVARLRRRETNPGRSPRIITSALGRHRPTARISNRDPDSTGISGLRVVRRKVRDRMHRTCGIPATPIIDQVRSLAPARGAIQSLRQVAVRVLSRSADRVPVTEAAVWIAAGIDPVPNLRRTRIIGCPVSKSSAGRVSLAGARLRRWRKTSVVPLRWGRALRNQADRKCEISMARAVFGWLRSSEKCALYLGFRNLRVRGRNRNRAFKARRIRRVQRSLR